MPEAKRIFSSFIPIFLSDFSFFCAMELEAGVGENEKILFLKVFFSESCCEQGQLEV